MGRERRATTADVARRAGVSRSTVSYVLNDTPGQQISSTTRARVLAAASELGYRPVAAARDLRRGRSDLVVCLMPPVPIGPVLGAILQDLSTRFGELGLAFVIHPLPHPPRPLAELWRSISPAAVIRLSPGSADEETAVAELGVPVATVVQGGDPRPGTIRLPNAEFGRTQAEHLLDAGHRRLGYAYPARSTFEPFAAPRVEAVAAACAERDAPPPDVRPVAPLPGAAREAVTAWRECGVTAVCAYNDEVAMALLAAAHSLGLRVPDDLAVIGSDDIPAAALTQPGLTTVTCDFGLIAEQVVAQVQAGLQGAPAAAQELDFRVRLVTRGSA